MYHVLSLEPVNQLTLLHSKRPKLYAVLAVLTAIGLSVCIPILVTTFPEWLSGTEPLLHTPGAVRLSLNRVKQYLTCKYIEQILFLYLFLKFAVFWANTRNAKISHKKGD